MYKIIDDIVNSIILFVEQCLSLKGTESVCIPDNVELKGLANTQSDVIKRKVIDWTKGSKYLEFKVTAQPGLYIRLNKSHFDFEDDDLTLNSTKAFSFFHRQRIPGRKHAKMTLICHLLTKGLGDKLIQHIQAIPFDKSLDTLVDDETYTARQSSIPTLEGFLSTYENLMYLENPNTAKTRVNLIRQTFSSMFNTPVNHIRGTELIGFMNGFKRNRTAVEIQEEASRFTVEESTMKGYIGVIRGLVSRASTFSNHPFKPCESLYCDALKFKINDDSDKFLTIDEIEHLINCLAERDRKGLLQSNNCHFKDYLTPLILLCLSTGLRPKYALKLKWSHIDFKNNQVIIKGGYGKIQKDNESDLTDEAVLVLKEWKKHIIHQKSQNNWVFPSPQTLKTHLTTYKTALTTFRNDYGLENFIMYDTRHTFATHFTAAYKNIDTTQAALHHACPKSTKRYSRHLTSSRKEATNAYADAIPSFSAALATHAMNNPKI